MVLVDSTVWIGLWKVGFDDLLAGEEPAVCFPIIQEVLQGARTQREYRSLREIFRVMVVLESPMSIEVVEEATIIYRTARSAGYTIRSGNDCLIAACAIRHNVPILHSDRDYAMIARVTALDARNVTS